MSAVATYENPTEVAQEEDEITIQIQNVVITINLNIPLDLEKISSSAKNAEYNPRRFQAVIMRIREPKTTALVFASGKIIVTGAKKVEQAQEAAKKYIMIINKVGHPDAKFLPDQFKVQNVTGTCDVGFPIRLEGFLFVHASNSTYEPELFPGLIYRLASPKVVLLIFVSGKIVITGAKDERQLQTALEEIYDKVSEFRKQNVIVKARKA